MHPGESARTTLLATILAYLLSTYQRLIPTRPRTTSLSHIKRHFLVSAAKPSLSSPTMSTPTKPSRQSKISRTFAPTRAVANSA